MPNYQNGKIYKITSPSTDKIYIGSTTQPLNRRFDEHKSYYKTSSVVQSSNKMLQYTDCVIELIEEYPCDTKRELEHKEQYYMNLYREIIVNSYNSIRKCRKKELRIYRSKPKNKQKMRVYKQNYRKKNKEQLNEKQRIYRNYQKSWGGHKYNDNNLLKISLDLFH